MRFRLFSDLHLEHDVSLVKRPRLADIWQPIPLESDADEVLILAGDIWNGTRPVQYAAISWLANLSARFKAVVLVLGNHDYWGDNVTTLTAKWRKLLAQQKLDNVHLLELADGPEHGSVVIEGVRLLGGTLWTNMDKGCPRVMAKFDLERGEGARLLWNDRNFIRAEGYSKFGSSSWLRRHRATVANLRAALTVGDEPVLMVTHHAPCMLSAERAGDVLAGYLYASDLSDLILDHPRIKLAVHGHTHEAHDYLMGDVRVRCNPRGYASHALVDGFDAVGSGTV